MDELGPIVFGIVWLLAALFGRRKQQGRSRRPAPSVEAPARRDRPVRAETFEDLLAEMREQLERAQESEAGGRQVEYAGDSADTIEEREVLETDPTVISLETEPVEWQRVHVAQDSEAEAIAARRRSEAEQRNREWRPEDHRRFDEVIRAAPVTASPRRQLVPAGAGLQRAIIWREVLDPPVALRDRR